jgi:uncharacterized protein (DUF1697 family)
VARVVALLRSINVGGRRLAMDDLRAIAADAGCSGVATLLATGNVVMDAPSDLAATANALREELARRHGDTAVLMRTHDELVDAVAANPFAAAVGAGEVPGNRVHTMFLAAAPSSEAVHRAQQEQPGGREQFAVVGRHLFGLYPDGMGRSKLTGNWLERRLGTGTMRNHNTVTKLVEATAPGA